MSPPLVNKRNSQRPKPVARSAAARPIRACRVVSDPTARAVPPKAPARVVRACRVIPPARVALEPCARTVHPQHCVRVFYPEPAVRDVPARKEIPPSPYGNWFWFHNLIIKRRSSVSAHRCGWCRCIFTVYKGFQLHQVNTHYEDLLQFNANVARILQQLNRN